MGCEIINHGNQYPIDSHSPHFLQFYEKNPTKEDAKAMEKFLFSLQTVLKNVNYRRTRDDFFDEQLKGKIEGKPQTLIRAFHNCYQQQQTIPRLLVSKISYF